jgi:hypothetical protein
MFYLWLDNIAITGAGDADPVFAWSSVPAGFTSVVQNPSGVVVNNPTTYTVQITNAYGCSGSGSVTVSPNALPSEPNATHATHCGTMLSAASVTGTDPQGSGVFNWYDAPTGGVLLQSSVSQTYLTPISTSVTLYVSELSDAGCESARTPVHITVTEADPISVSASADSLCLNNTVTLTAQKTGNTNSYTYSWQASPGGHGLTGNETDEIINVTPQSSGLFTYEVTGTDILRNCVSTASVSVYVHALPEITRVAASPDSVCLGEPVTLTAGSEPDEIFGIVGTGTGTNTATTYPSAFGTYWGNARAQYLIRAAELLTGGLTAGYIQTIAFDVEAVGAAAALNGYTIKLGTTTLDAMTVTINDPSVTVFGPVNYTPITGMNTLSLHTPFYWNGTDNLFVEICFNNGSAGGTNTLTKMTATDFASSAYTGNDNTSGNICFSNLTAASANRPNMQFSGTVIPDPTSNYLYTWQPLNMTGTQITVTPGASTVYSVTATDVQTGCVSATATASVYAAAPLTVSADITGPTGASGHVTGQPPAIYSVTAQNATAYVWDIPTGATNVSGQGTPSISFNYPAGYPGGTIGVTVYAQEPCAPVTRTLYITYDCPPAPQVDGIVNVCPYTNGTTELTYRVVNAVPTVIYQWSVPPNVHIVSGQGTDEIRITIDPTFIAQANQQIRVYGISACAQTPATIFYLRTQFPMTPQPITGLTEVCAYIETGNTVSYSISDVTAAENYVWTVPTGVTIVSGQGSTEISVVFEDDFETDYIRVRAENRCGGSPERSIKVFRNRPSAPGVISGPRNLCTMIPSGATGGTIQVVYSVTPQPGLTYNWSVPAGMAIINGQGTHSITTEVDDNYSGGNIEVFATGTCGSGSVRSLSLSTLRPGTPGNILQEVLQNCPGRLVRYYLENTPSNSNYLEWTVPVGATLMSGQGTTSVTVSYPETTVSGTVTVTARNGCGVSTTRKHNVSLEVCPPVPAPTLYVKGQPDNGKKHAMEISVYPNPFVHTFYLDILGANDQTPIYIQIVDELGRVRFEMQSVKTSGIPVSAGLKSGNYWITVRQEKNRATQKLVVLGE